MPFERVGRYLILRPLGAGAMSRTQLAYDPRDDRLVVVKRAPAGGGPALSARLREEIRVARRLGHPRLLPVLDHGELQTGPFLVTPWLPGRNLEELADRARRYQQPIPPAAAAAIARALLLALEHAHVAAGLGLVHRDVCPGNVLCGYQGEVLLGDFGLARAHGRPGITLPGAATGTPGFAAPEQGRGEPVDARADLYSVGAILWFLLVGRTPHDPRLPALAGPDLPALIEPTRLGPRWVELLVRVCDPEPALRYPDASALLDALDRCAPERHQDGAAVAALTSALFPGEARLRAEELGPLRALARAQARGPEPPRRRPHLAFAIALLVGAAWGALPGERSAPGPDVGILRQAVTAELSPIPQRDPNPHQLARPIADPPASARPSQAELQRDRTPSSRGQRSASLPATSLSAGLAEARAPAHKGQLARAGDRYASLGRQPAAGARLAIGRAELELERGRLVEANALLTRAIAQGAGPRAFILRGELHLRAGRLTAAEADFRAVLLHQPRDPLARKGLARARAARSEASGMSSAQPALPASP